MTDPVAVRTYEVLFSDGSAIRVDIPADWKITFGPIVGAANAKGGEYGKPNAFRAWESENKQRLLLTGVVSFRDTSLPMRRRAVRKFGSEDWVEDDGSWRGTKALDVEKRWVPVDDETVTLTDADTDDDKDFEDGSIAHPKRLAGMHPRRDRSFTIGAK